MVPRYSPARFVQLTMVGWTGDFLRRAVLAGAAVASGLASLARPVAPGNPGRTYCSPHPTANAGDLHFGKDGYLYISTPTVGAPPGELERRSSLQYALAGLNLYSGWRDHAEEDVGF